MNDEGFIKLHRKMISWGWYKDSKVKALFIHCLLKANHKDSQWQNVSVRRGSFVTSITHLVNETGLTVKEVRRALDILITSECIRKSTSASFTMITVINYDEYQAEGKEKGKAKGKAKTSENPHKQCVSDTSAYTEGQAKGQGKGQAKGIPQGKEKGKAKGKAEKAGNLHEQSVSDICTYEEGQAKGQGKGQTQGKPRATNKNDKKYSSPIREKNTADTSARPEGGGHVPLGQTSTDGLVPAKEMIDFSNTVPGGQVFLVWEFRSGFEQSGTIMPPNWQELYERYVAAEESNRIEFLKRLSAGEYRERWGSADDAT